jgi:hypothetical protein
MGEARTQHFVVNSDQDPAVLTPRIYYTFRYQLNQCAVMEYIDGAGCKDEEFGAVAGTVRRFRSRLSKAMSIA